MQRDVYKNSRATDEALLTLTGVAQLLIHYDTLLTQATKDGNYDLLCVALDLQSAWRDIDLLEPNERDAIQSVLCNDVTSQDYAEQNCVSVETVHRLIRDGVAKIHDDLTGYEMRGDAVG